MKAYEQNVTEAITEGRQSILSKQEIPGKEKKCLNLAFCPLKFDTISAAVIVIEDITDIEKKDEQLRQAQKMEAIGQLAGGVAHDFNNLLTPIMGNAELMILDPSLDTTCRNKANNIINAAEKARALTMKLLTVSRKQDYILKPVNFCNIISGFEKILRRTIRENIRMYVNIPVEPVMIMADAGLIEQVIMNMAVNAQDAIHDSGVVSIELAFENLDESYSMHHVSLKPGQYAVLSFSDSGEGMDSETIERIFEPFFTTKEPGKGTGLGLSTVFGIIEKHSGAIRVYSEKGKGTTFRIYIPITASSDVQKPVKQDSTHIVGGHETILLVEDDQDVLTYIEGFLSSIGYRVIAFSNPRECLEHVTSNQESIHLLLTDVIMPEMSGRELFNKIIEKLPDIKCIFMSGYSISVIGRQGIQDNDVNFIQKPFNIKLLAKKVKDALESNPA